jgi:hypothetical protein
MVPLSSTEFPTGCLLSSLPSPEIAGETFSGVLNYRIASTPLTEGLPHSVWFFGLACAAVKRPRPLHSHLRFLA